ncbi:hypothetical protein F4780DRAFT_771211 [Xylariomycetidae sp. FL0641]|nr:hypothetical protein F4780DRAFT_771211 [Xylariomycetidae sp. FL0641]
MPGERIVIDGLWRCLCPSIDLATLAKAATFPRTARRPSAARGPALPASQRRCRRGVHLDHRQQLHPILRNDHEAVEKSRIAYLQRVAKRSPWVPGELFAGAGALSSRLLERIPIRTIYAALQELQTIEGSYFTIVKLVEYLVIKRGQGPSAMLYECLIRANTDPVNGSAQVASQLLEEMERLRLPITPQIYQAVLDVTAVHPDYVLRSAVLFKMKNRWYTPTASDRCSIIIGLLRDGQYESALAELQDANKNPADIPVWLFDVFLYTFGELGFHEEALEVLKHRLRVAVAFKTPLSLNAWSFLLDTFSRDAFYPGIKYIWDLSVSQGHLNPSDGVALNILNAASQQGDVTLAMSAIHLLSTRGTELHLHHYEALLHAHMQHGDLRRALVILCIMGKAHLSPDLSCTRPIAAMLRESSTATSNALRILQELRSQYTVPTAAFNVVLEASQVHHGFKVALDLYRSVRQICANGPSIETYHLLFENCTSRKSMKFLFEEMQAFKIKPTKTTFDHLIRISCMQDNYEPAFQYLELLNSRDTLGSTASGWVSKGSSLALIRRCILAEDPRVQPLIQECRDRGIPIEPEVGKLLEDVEAMKQLEATKASEAAKASKATEKKPPARRKLASTTQFPVLESMTG